MSNQHFDFLSKEQGLFKRFCKEVLRTVIE